MAGYPSEIPPGLPDAHTHLPRPFETNGRDFPFPGAASSIVCSAEPNDWDTLASLARQYPERIIPSFGIHPWHAGNASDIHWQRLTELLDEFPMAGVGETGMDKAHRPRIPQEAQEKSFRTHLGIAREKNRFVTLHCVRAWGPVLKILDELPPPRLLVHAWHGPSEHVSPLLKHNALFSVGSRQLMDESCHAAIRSLPPERLLPETDGYTGNLIPAFRYLCSLFRDCPPEWWLIQIRENYMNLSSPSIFLP